MHKLIGEWKVKKEFCWDGKCFNTRLPLIRKVEPREMPTEDVNGTHIEVCFFSSSHMCTNQIEFPFLSISNVERGIAAQKKSFYCADFWVAFCLAAFI